MPGIDSQLIGPSRTRDIPLRGQQVPKEERCLRGYVWVPGIDSQLIRRPRTRHIPLLLEQHSEAKRC